MAAKVTSIHKEKTNNCPICRKNIDKDLEIIQDYKYKQSSYCSSNYSTGS